MPDWKFALRSTNPFCAGKEVMFETQVQNTFVYVKGFGIPLDMSERKSKRMLQNIPVDPEVCRTKMGSFFASSKLGLYGYVGVSTGASRTSTEGICNLLKGSSSNIIEIHGSSGSVVIKMLQLN